MEDKTNLSFDRLISKFENLSENYVIREKEYKRQYAHVYASRLKSEWPQLEQTARLKWSNIPILKLTELQTDNQCIVIGTLFKDMVLKPSILQEVGEDQQFEARIIRDKYIDPSDKLILEDESQRIHLIGNINVGNYVTGVLIGVLGMERSSNKGKFDVVDIIHRQLPCQIDKPLFDDDKYVAIISGIDLNGSIQNIHHFQMFIDLLTGHLGSTDTHLKMSKISRLLIAGNSIGMSISDKDQALKAKYQSKKTSFLSKNAICLFDDMLCQLVGSIMVDVMPGESDPTNFTLPQQPMHPCLFPCASTYSSFRCLPNPSSFSIDGINFIGSSGQPVKDYYKFSELVDDLDIMERLLTFGHLAPSAPDTLGLYPFIGQDPLLIKSSPHVFFTANSDKYGSRMWVPDCGPAIKLITIPTFSKTFSVVLLNLKNLDCERISIKG